MSEWTIFDGTNPPTDRSRYLHLMYDDDWDCVETIYTPGWGMDAHMASHIVRWRYLDIEPYQPEPELLPCRCGGDATRGPNNQAYCDDPECSYFIEAPTQAEADRMWNAAQRDDEFVRRCDAVAGLHYANTPRPYPDPKPEPEMSDWPTEIMTWVDPIPDDYLHGRWDALRDAENPECPSMEYIRKDEYDKVVDETHELGEANVELRKQLKNAQTEERGCRWETIENSKKIHTQCERYPTKDWIKPHYAYVFCPYCGKRIEVSK